MGLKFVLNQTSSDHSIYYGCGSCLLGNITVCRKPNIERVECGNVGLAYVVYIRNVRLNDTRGRIADCCDDESFMFLIEDATKAEGVKYIDAFEAQLQKLYGASLSDSSTPSACSTEPKKIYRRLLVAGLIFWVAPVHSLATL